MSFARTVDWETKFFPSANSLNEWVARPSAAFISENIGKVGESRATQPFLPSKFPDEKVTDCDHLDLCILRKLSRFCILERKSIYLRQDIGPKTTLPCSKSAQIEFCLFWLQWIYLGSVLPCKYTFLSPNPSIGKLSKLKLLIFAPKFSWMFI